jgi:hypothetical protein
MRRLEELDTALAQLARLAPATELTGSVEGADPAERAAHELRISREKLIELLANAGQGRPPRRIHPRTSQIVCRPAPGRMREVSKRAPDRVGSSSSYRRASVLCHRQQRCRRRCMELRNKPCYKTGVKRGNDWSPTPDEGVVASFAMKALAAGESGAKVDRAAGDRYYSSRTLERIAGTGYPSRITASQIGPTPAFCSGSSFTDPILSRHR